MDNKIFIRERLNIVDYDNNNQGIIYTSSDIDIEGGAVNVQLESDVGGWHQLTFDMPAFIVEEGKHIQNPLLKHLFPLSKIQYTRVVKEKDKEEELILYFIVQPQDGTRDDSGIVLYNFTCIDYPRHYLSKAKNGITIGEDTLDEKRSMTPNNEIMNVDGKIIYVKAPVQSKMDFVNEAQLITWGDAKPGAFAYIPSTKKAYRLITTDVTAMYNTTLGQEYKNWYELREGQTFTRDDKGNPVPEPVWCPDWEDYPLAPDVNNYDYGALNINDIDPGLVQFYWDIEWLDPDRTIGRYDGMLFQNGSRLLYNVYETTDYEFPKSFLGPYYKVENLRDIVASVVDGATAYVIETNTVWRWNGSTWEDTYQNKREFFKIKDTLKGEWSKLDPIKPYLAPNYAEKYLDYILEGTGWKVGEVDKIMVDTGTVEFGEDGVVKPEQQELTTSLYFDNSNAYNAITELCNAFKCYPRFDHVNKTVSLKAVPGLDYGLTYQWRDNLANTRITQDGEKAVSKLWVYGGEDTLGEVTIADCNRMNPDYYLADYTSLQDLKDRVNKPNEGQYAQISLKYKWKQLISETLNNGKRLPIVNTFKAGELKVTSWGTGSIPVIEDISQLPKSGELGQTIFIENENTYWSWIPEANSWFDTFQESEPEDEFEIVFKQRYDYENGDWISKGQFYHWWETLSPFADNYILDFSYFLERKLMTEEQEKDIKYNYILPISRLNRKRWPLYKEYQHLNGSLLTWNATYDECKIARDAIDKSLKTSYAIYQKTGDLIEYKESVDKYPVGADKGTLGWVIAAISYSDSNATEYNTYADLPKNPTIGQYAKVKDEVQVYYYHSTFDFEDTIAAYLGYAENQITDPNKRKKEYLKRNNLEARVRTEGLFEKLREFELWQDKTRQKLAPWFNPPANIHEVPVGPIGDPTVSSTMHPYYDAQQRFVAEQINMDDAMDRIMELETQMTLLLEKIEHLENQIKQLEWSLREKYGDFIVEGVFTDDTLVWKYNLWYAGLEALQLYHRPLVTYELGVVDVSGLPEYRTVTTDIYHDIVYRMNQAELVLPDPGDYCYVTDNTLGLVAEKANITSIIRNLSNPSQHQITIATVDTNTEDLIGKVVTAANTIYSKEQIYNRSAIITKDGTIAQDNLANSLDDNSGKLTIMSNNGTVILGDNGITTVDRDDANARMQYTGKGIFASTNGGVTWENIVNAGKISIKSLSAGTIDSNNISVTNIGHDASIVIDGRGISAVNYTGATNSPDATPIRDTHVSFFLDATTGNAYFKGCLSSGSGDIGGWKIEPERLSTGDGNSFVGLAPRINSNSYAFWAGNTNPSSAPVWIKHDGSAQFTNIVVKGNSSVDGKNLVDGSVETIKIGNQQITMDKIKDQAVSANKILPKSITETQIKDYGITTPLIATDAVIARHIKAGSVTADKISVNSLSAISANLGSIEVDNAHIKTLSVEKITRGTNDAAVTFNSMTTNKQRCNNGDIRGGTIRIGGNTDSFSESNFSVDNSGNIFLNDAYIQFGDSFIIKADDTTTVRNQPPFNTPIKIPGEDTTIGVYGDGGWGSFKGWHVGIPGMSITVCRDVAVGGFGSFYTINVVKGLIIGLTPGRDN